MTDRRNQ